MTNRPGAGKHPTGCLHFLRQKSKGKRPTPERFFLCLLWLW